MSGLTRSINVIETILDDMKQSYSGAGGGGIASVRQRATSTYEVTVLEEERKVIVRYRLSFDADGGISIAERSETAESQP